MTRDTNAQADLDNALAGILNSSWDTPATSAPPAEDLGHDLTGGEADPLVEPASQPTAPTPEPEEPASHIVARALGQEPVRIPLPEPEPEYDPDVDTSRARLGLGALVDLASGRKSATAIAAQAGVTDAELHDRLATALKTVPPEEIGKAMGLQAAEQQLKSGAVYGAVLADLVQDMLHDRLKPETKIELAKMLARIGKLEPKEDRNAGVGGGFILNISLGNTDPAPITIESE